MKKIVFVVLMMPLFLGCSKNRLKVDVSDIEADVKITRLEKLMFEKDPGIFQSNMERVLDEHRPFFDIYTQYVLKIGTADSSNFEAYLGYFLTDTVITQVADSTLSFFDDFDPYHKQLVDGFKHYKYYFPYKPIPAIYTCISGFNESVFTTGPAVGIALDKYLGADCVFYGYLGIPRYKSRRMYPERMIPDLFYSLYMSEYTKDDPADNLLSEMIYQGKARYFTEAMCPALPDTVLLGYTEKQAEWCRENETAMWLFLVEHKLLYSNERLIIQKYTGDAPFTNTFSNESPGKTGSWLGWRIVHEFMDQNPEVTLPDMINKYSAQQILAFSGYNPN